MSLNVNPLRVQRVVDPRLEIKEGSRLYNAVGGSMVNSWQQFNATNRNNTNIQITCNPPSQNICISRLVYKRVSFNWRIDGVNTSGGVLLNSGYVAPRCMPLTSITNAEQITLGNDTITTAPVHQYWRALLRYRNDLENRNGVFSLSPSMLDQHQDYADGVGGIRNPLAGYDDNSAESTRGSYTGFSIDPQIAGNTTATGTLTTIEPILMSPFAFGENSNNFQSFIGLQNMSYNATLSNLSRILSVVQGQGAPAGQIVLNEPIVEIAGASILCNYFTPDPTYSPVPSVSEYSYFSCVSYPTRHTAPVLPGASAQLTMASVQVSSIPKRIYVFARRDDSEENAFTTDSYFALPKNTNPISLTWNNNQFLATASSEDLFNISVKNGCNMSYTQFSDKTGSVLALDFGIDVGLQPNQSPGSLGNYQLGLTCNFVNTTNETIVPTLYVVVVSEGVFNITSGSASHMIGVLSPDDILNAPMAPEGTYDTHMDVYGGSWRGFKDLVKKGLSYAKEHKLISRGLASTGNPYGQMASKVASALGYGLSGGNINFDKNNKKKAYKTKTKRLSDNC
jgi:hypothetical protein